MTLNNRLKAVFLAASLSAMPLLSSAQVNYNSGLVDKTKTTLSGDFGSLTHKGRPFDPSVIKDKTALLYFGTPFRNPSCSQDLYSLATLKSKYCDDIEIIFVSPVFKGVASNSNIKVAEAHNIYYLQGDLGAVVTLAKEFGVKYGVTGDHNSRILIVEEHDLDTILNASREVATGISAYGMISAVGCSLSDPDLR